MTFEDVNPGSAMSWACREVVGGGSDARGKNLASADLDEHRTKLKVMKGSEHNLFLHGRSVGYSAPALLKSSLFTSLLYLGGRLPNWLVTSISNLNILPTKRQTTKSTNNCNTSEEWLRRQQPSSFQIHIEEAKRQQRQRSNCAVSTLLRTCEIL